MALAPTGERVLGYFTEKSHGRQFEYSENDQLILFPLAHGGKNVRYPHKIFVGSSAGPERDYRYAFVKESVVHVVVDETELGWQVERWDIVKHRKLV